MPHPATLQNSFPGSFFRPAHKRKQDAPPRAFDTYNPDDPNNEYARGDFWDDATRPELLDNLTQHFSQPVLPVPFYRVQQYLSELSYDQRRRLDRCIAQYLTRFQRGAASGGPGGVYGSYYWGLGTRVVCEDIIRRGMDVDEVELPEPEIEE